MRKVEPAKPQAPQAPQPELLKKVAVRTPLRHWASGKLGFAG